MAQSLSFFDELRSQHDRDLQRREGSPIVRFVNETSNQSTRLGHIVGLLPISYPCESGRCSWGLSVWLGVEAAAFLAILDFNRRESRLVPQLSKRLAGCDLYMTMDLRDTQFSVMSATSRLLEAASTGTVPMGLVGSARSAVSSIVANLAGVIEASGRTRPGVSGNISSIQGIPQISPASTSRDLDNKDRYPYFARTVPDNRGDALALVTYMKSVGATTFGVLFDNDSYGVEFVANIAQSAQEQGLNIVTASYDDEATDSQSLQSAIKYLMDSNLRYFFGVLTGTTRALRELHNAGLIGAPGYTWLFADVISDLLTDDIDISDPDGLLLHNALNRTGLIFLESPKAQDAILQEMLDDLVVQDDLHQYYISKHFEQDLQFPDGSIYVNPEASIFPLLSYDAAMALSIAACEAESDFFTGPELYDTLKKVDFEGATGRVTFSSATGTREIDYVKYSIANILVSQPDPDTTIAHISTHTSSIIDVGRKNVVHVEDFIFSDGTTTPPPASPESQEDLNLVLESGVWWFCVALGMLGMYLAIGCAAWTFKYRDTNVVRSSQPLFLGALCVGVFFMSASIITSSFQEPMPQNVLDLGCMFSVWLLCFGFTTTFAAFFAKTYRIREIIRNSQAFRRLEIRAFDLAWPFLILWSLNFTVLLIFTIKDPLKYTRVPLETNFFGRVVSSYGSCQSGSRSKNQTFYIFLLVCINCLALVVSNYMSWKARDLPARWNETIHHTVTNLIMLEGILIGGPILFLLAEEPAAHLVVRSVLVFVISLAAILPLFVTKQDQVRRSISREQGSSGQEKSSLKSSKNCSSTPSTTKRVSFADQQAVMSSTTSHETQRVRISGLSMDSADDSMTSTSSSLLSSADSRRPTAPSFRISTASDGNMMPAEASLLASMTEEDDEENCDGND